MNKIAIFPGSFDPITKGHESIIKRASPLFDKIIVAIGINSTKKGMFEIEVRENWVRETFKDISNVEVVTYNDLTINLCKKEKANYILRGLRNTIDFEYENAIAQMNKKINPEVETYFLLTAPEFSAISSSIVKEIYKNGGNIAQFIPKAISIP